MARGLSRRMGSPKGLLRLDPGGPTFVKAIADLYRGQDIFAYVVVSRDNAEAYHLELRDREGLRVIEGEEGGDTALTLAVAWRAQEHLGFRCSHFWAHPVDLPLVEPATIRLLLDESRRHPDSLIRPVWSGDPGHPVIIPAAVLEALEGMSGWRIGSFRDCLSEAVAEGTLTMARTVPVVDVGVVHDFDCPTDLPAAPPPS